MIRRALCRSDYVNPSVTFSRIPKVSVINSTTEKRLGRGNKPSRALEKRVRLHYNEKVT